jgi:hypothetical protein
MNKTLKDLQLATLQWNRYLNGMDRGHEDYQRQAKVNEDFYLGGGRQWSEEDKEALESTGRPWLEENIIFSTVNTVIGTQTQSRMDLAYKPRESDDQHISDTLTKISKFIIDQNKLPWQESQVFSDGLIQQRGFFDIRMDFADNIYGDIGISTLDPLDVIPDPDAKSYDPDDWSDVITTQWLPMDDLKETYGLAKWRKVQSKLEDESDWGESDDGQERNKFGTNRTGLAFYRDNSEVEHAKVIDRQYWKLQNREFFFNIEAGDLTPVPSGITASEKRSLAKAEGSEIIKRLIKRVRWTVSTRDVVLHDEWSPYDHFTIVPYFPYFRRGVTVGLVDNLIKTQEMINKVYSQMLHSVNSTANSGWLVEENSLVNMDSEDLETLGSQTGLVIEYKAGRSKPEKIEPNQVPTGLKDLVTTSVDLIRLISGVSETFQGGSGNEISGTAIQSRVQQSAVQLASPIDNLFRTRNMLAERLLKLIQQFYTEERSFLITENDDDGNEQTKEVTLNQEDEDGNVLNDVTVGKYDVVIADVPTAITFQNSQFAQAIEMRKFGVEIPDEEMVLMSTLARKSQIADKIAGGPTPEQQEAAQEEQTLQIETLEAEVVKLESEAKKKDTDSMKQIADVALLLSENPEMAGIMDSLSKQVNKSDDLPNLGNPQQEQLITDDDIPEEFSNRLGGI